jgi:hypothetical protein
VQLKRALISLTVALALAVPLSAPAGTSATRVTGTTGPGFTITLKRAGKKVTTLRPGKYTFAVSDRSTAHDFVLNGPGVRNRTITGLAFTGPRSPTITLKKGRYEYYCTPHRRMGMRGFFTVR